MNGTRFLQRAVIGFLVFMMAVPGGSFAQNPGTGATFSREALDQMLAPIALYPDSLVAQILMASTFTAEVDEANQWLAQNKDLRGDQLNAALDQMNWDLSVKALIPFPRVLAMMSDKREWTQRMGEAFMGQEADVMDSIQRLRSEAYAAGNLKSNEQQRVIVRGKNIEIVPVNPQIVHVPTYNPATAYGTWGYPSYPPYAYSPYYPAFAYDPNYVVPGLIVAGVIAFAAGVAVASAWNHGWGHWDWGHRHVNVNVNRRVNINRDDYRIKDVRTSSWHKVHRERATREIDRQPSGRTGAKRSVERTDVKTGKKPYSTSVQQGAAKREGQDQVRQRKTPKQGKATSVQSGRVKDATADRGAAARERKGGAKQRDGSPKKDGRQDNQ